MIFGDASTYDGYTLFALSFALGMRHGLDPDHLVAIDGLTRFNAVREPERARWCGALFSLGHGGVVVLVALAVATVGGAWSAPGWLEDLGVWVSVVLLLALGTLNLCAAWMAPADSAPHLVGVRGGLFGGLQRASHPLLIGLVGAAFALSLDTLSQAALFALLGTRVGGVEHCVMLGAVFTAGMVLVDGVNGWWVFRMAVGASRRAPRAARVFAVLVAALSYLLAGLTLAGYAFPQINAWSEDKALAIGVGVIGVVALSFVAALRLARRELARGA